MKRLCSAILLAALGLNAGPGLAQGYPSKPMRIIVPFVAGGAVDTLARMMGAKLAETFDQPVIVENRPGAGGNVAADAVAKSPPDGYTILQNTNGQAISPAIYRSLPFDVVKDFIPVTQLVASQLVLVASPKLEATSVRELIALAKAKPGRLNYGMTGVGNPLHLTMEMFKTAAGVDIQAVPYKGDAAIFPALITGEIHVAVVPMATSRRTCAGGIGARARDRRRQALGGAARRADRRRERPPRLRIDELAGLVRAGRTRRARSLRIIQRERRQGADRTRSAASGCTSAATRRSAARRKSSRQGSRPTSRNLPRSSRKPIFRRRTELTESQGDRHGHSRSRICRRSRQVARGLDELRHQVPRDAAHRQERQEPGAAHGRPQAARGGGRGRRRGRRLLRLGGRGRRHARRGSRRSSRRPASQSRAARARSPTSAASRT